MYDYLPGNWFSIACLICMKAPLCVQNVSAEWKFLLAQLELRHSASRSSLEGSGGTERYVHTTTLAHRV